MHHPGDTFQDDFCLYMALSKEYQMLTDITVMMIMMIILLWLIVVSVTLTRMMIFFYFNKISFEEMTIHKKMVTLCRKDITKQ